MLTFAERLSSHWEAIGSLLGTGFAFVLGLAYWVMHLGGKQRLVKWVLEVEAGEQNDSARRIICGCNALVQAQGSGGVNACSDLIAGLDQWRALQVRITQRSGCVRRSNYPICAYLGFAAAGFILHFLESSTHTWSALLCSGLQLHLPGYSGRFHHSLTWHGKTVCRRQRQTQNRLIATRQSPLKIRTPIELPYPQFFDDLRSANPIPRSR